MIKNRVVSYNDSAFKSNEVAITILFSVNTTYAGVVNIHVEYNNDGRILYCQDDYKGNLIGHYYVKYMVECSKAYEKILSTEGGSVLKAIELAGKRYTDTRKKVYELRNCGKYAPNELNKIVEELYDECRRSMCKISIK